MIKQGDCYRWSLYPIEPGANYYTKTKIVLEEYASHYVRYLVYRVIDEEEFLYLDYSVKWDGCSNLLHADVGYMHFCGTQVLEDGLNTYFSLLYHLYYNAFVLMNIHPDNAGKNNLLPHSKEDHPDTIKFSFGEVNVWD